MSGEHNTNPDLTCRNHFGPTLRPNHDIAKRRVVEYVIRRPCTRIFLTKRM